MKFERRRILKWMGTALAGTALARMVPAFSASRLRSIRLAGGASYKNGKVHFSGASYVIKKQGWLDAQLKARGITLEWYPVTHAATGPMINEGFASGRVDFASYGDLPSAILNAGGVETRVIVPNGVAGGDAFLVVPWESSAKTIDDLKGQRLAVHRGRPWELPLLRLLNSKGLEYGDFKFFNLNPQAGMAALTSKKIDALFTMIDAYLLEEKGVGRIIWSTRDAPLDWRTRTELWGLKSFVDANPDITQLVATAYVKAAHWSSQEANREELIRNAVDGGTPESVARRSNEDSAFSWKDRHSPLFNPVVAEHYRNTMALALENRIIARPLDVDGWLDQRFVPVALRELGLEGYWQPSGAMAQHSVGA
jgi:sulfonate transport system substrate-binding protein